MEPQSSVNTRSRSRPKQPGRNQVVVATPRDGGGAGWEFGSVSRQFARCAATCGRLGRRRRRVARIGSGSGRRSLVTCRAKAPPWRAGCRKPSVRGGSVRLAGCRRSRWLRSRAVTCRSLNEKRSRSCTHRTWGYVRSLATSVEHYRRSRGSCAATPPPARIAWSIGPRRPSGTRSAEPAARRFQAR
jgi:hypothetical protein